MSLMTITMHFEIKRTRKDSVKVIDPDGHTLGRYSDEDAAKEGIMEWINEECGVSGFEFEMDGEVE